MIEMVINSIRVSLVNYQRVVILKEKAAERSEEGRGVTARRLATKN